MRMKTIQLAALVLLLSLFVLSACSGNNASNSNNNDNSNENEIEDLDEHYRNANAELTVYGLMSLSQWQDRYETYLREEFPNYNFNYVSWEGDDGTSIEELLASNLDIDLYFAAAHDFKGRFVPSQIASPITELMDRHGIDPDIFEDGYLEATTIDDEIYMLPLSNNGFVMYYNRELFNQFGLPEPWDGMSWDEAIALGRDFTRVDNGKQYIGLWYSPRHYMRINQKSLGFVDPETNKATLDNPEWNEVISTLFHEALDDSGIRNRAQEKFFGHDDFNRDYVVGMYVFTNGWMNSHTSSLPMDWDVVAVPTFDGDGVGAQAYANYVGISSTSNVKDEATQVIKYLTSEDFQMGTSSRGSITPLKSQAVKDVFMDSIDGVQDKNLQAVFYNSLAPPRPMTEFDETIIEDVLDAVILREIVTGQKAVNEGLRDAEEMANREIETRMLR